MFAKLIETLKANPRTLVFTEGSDARILEATDRLKKDGFLTPILVGDEAEVKAAAAKGGFDIEGIRIVNPATYEGMDAMVEKINAIPGLSCRKPQGAFYIMMNIKQMLGKHYDGRMIESSLDFAELLLAEKQVALVPGVAFEAEGYCRLSYAVSMENILEGLSRIGEFVAELS